MLSFEQHNVKSGKPWLILLKQLMISVLKKTERIQWEAERQQFNENFAATIKGLNAILTALTPLNPVETVATLSLIKAGMDNPVEEVLKHRHTHEPQ